MVIMEELELLHKLDEQDMLSKEHLEFHGIPIEGAFFNLFAKFEEIGFAQSVIPRSDNKMFMSKPSENNDMALMVTIGEPSMCAYEIREMIPTDSLDIDLAKEAKIKELKLQFQTVDVPGGQSENLLIMQGGKYTGIINVEKWESDDSISYIAVKYIDAQCMLTHDRSDFE